MSTTAKNAILKAKIDGVVSELLVKTDAANVYIDGYTTLASKLSSIIADIATKASTEELTAGLAGKSNVGHKHSLADINEATTATNVVYIVNQNTATYNMSMLTAHLPLSTAEGASAILTIGDKNYTSSTGATSPDGGMYTLVVTDSNGETYTLTQSPVDDAINISPAIPSGSTYALTATLTSATIDQKYIDATIARNTDVDTRLNRHNESTTAHTDIRNSISELNTSLTNEVQTLNTALEGKANSSHTHAQSDITGLSDALDGKANASHTHAQSEITGLTDALALLASTESVTEAIDALRQEMLGDAPVEAYNTFTELAAYIAEHKEVSDALTAAIGNKADKATTLEGYGIADAYTKTQVDTKISEAIQTATGGESAASVKLALDNYKTDNDATVNALKADSHTHANKTVLDGISTDKISAWDAKAKVYYSAEEPANLTENDLWVQIVE